jgi:predicted signal transduction protein with EAL and GGDEF domain
VHKLKIDQSFIRDLTVDRDDAAIVNAIVGLAGSLGLDILAEGVETRAQLDALLALGCEQVPGQLFAPPLPPIGADEIFRPRLPKALRHNPRFANTVREQGNESSHHGQRADHRGSGCRRRRRSHGRAACHRALHGLADQR